MADNIQQGGNLHVPQSKSSSAFSSQSVKDIMDAYRTQSKIQLYDDSSSQTAGAQNESVGVTGRNIPLSMLRPSANPVQNIDENGNPVMQRPSRGRILQEMQSYGDIAKAYNSMRGIEEADENEGEYGGTEVQAHKGRTNADLSKIKRFEADYVEDMPDDDEGLLGILELAINNARANLEMLESLYAALSPQSSDDSFNNYEENY